MPDCCNNHVMMRKADSWKGLAAGLAGGIVGSLLMNQFQALLAKVGQARDGSSGAQTNKPGPPHHGIALALQKRGQDEDNDDATMRLGNAIVSRLANRNLSKEDKTRAGAVVHYLFGGCTGAVYGLAAEWLPEVTTGAGLPMGAFVWAAADEAAVPAMGLSRWPGDYPISSHANAFASHMVYGLATELVRWAVRKRLEGE